ncbi:RagB/SusD family nutrient uptake outer membrane protein [Marinoscillum sp. MHG1-6]|uniref:RagB/SusD family nutrient uptake outer membrane protein n=1 Tax=Marinoscillum sp. MHG1-6 TaxID=2959627 RepID=UPI0021577BF4|nr:RagB/SusD family nutrient uptake outer membrane protein [Marinoscillum sp. MHG1-6]
MKKLRHLFILLTGAFMINSCSDFLEVSPQGTISDEELNSPENIDGLIISAYAMLGNDHYSVPNMLWPWGDLRGGDAYKGGDGPADIAIYHAMEVFSTIQPDMSAYAPSALGDLNNKKWERLYTSISRTNNALARLNEMEDGEYARKTERTAEMRFLRAHYYFDLKILYKQIPWIDENASAADIEVISNTEFTSDQLWGKIAADLAFAADNLPASQSEVGRPNKFTAKAYLAKVLLYQAYEQNETHEVVNINQPLLEQVVTLVDEVIASGKFGLEGDFADPFLWENENGPESVWAIQRSHDDGTNTGNIDYSAMLNSPMSLEFGCCWFHIPSQNLVNAYKTDVNGLPLFDTYNDADLDLGTNTVDPRLDHTVAQPGKPWKYETSIIYTEADWARQPGIYGPYSSLKENVSPNCDCFERLPPFMSSSKNTILMRYADVLLWKAEALIELGRQNEALPIINDIRNRAKSSTTLLVDNLGNDLSDYSIEPYTSTGWTQEYARQALRWERRLELSMEGHRFFDLVRWGVASETLGEYFQMEKNKREYLSTAGFVKGKHEYLPIPQQQINLSNGRYQQNNGYN